MWVACDDSLFCVIVCVLLSFNRLFGSSFITELREKYNVVQNIGGPNDYLLKHLGEVLVGDLFSCLSCVNFLTFSSNTTPVSAEGNSTCNRVASSCSTSLIFCKKSKFPLSFKCIIQNYNIKHLIDLAVYRS